MIHDVVIYKANETNFNHEGLGVLIDFVEDVEVTENNRGFFELKFTYSLNGKLAQSITEEAYIKTVANERQEEPLIFRVYQSEPDYIERLIYVRARLKIIDDMMNSVHKSIVFPKSFGITPIIEGLFKNAVPSLNYRLSGSVNNLHDIPHEDDTVYEHLFQENGLFVMNDITPLYTPLGMTINTTRGNKRVDTITEQDFINKFKIIRERKNMITAIIPWTVTKRDEFVANEEDDRRSYRDTVEEKVYGEIIVSPKVASHGYPFIAKFMEFKNEVTREWEENNRTMREYKYQSVEDLNKASQNFFTENKGIDEYSIEASIETLGLHMDYMKRLSSLGLYDEVEFYLEEHDLKIVLAVSEVTYSPSLDMNLALTFQSNTSTLSKAGQRINANAPSERDLQNLIERERLKEIVRNYIDKDDGTRTYWVSELPDPATAGEQDIAFLETAEGKSIWVLINGVWVEKLPLNFEERLRDELERLDTQTQAMEAAIQENEAKARELFGTMERTTDLALEAHTLIKSIEDMRKEIETISDTAEIEPDFGQMYNKNRAEFGEAKIPLGTDKITVRHNGKGFEIGQTYTISFKADCIPHPSGGLTLTLNRRMDLPTSIRLVPRTKGLPTVDDTLTVNTKTLASVYESVYDFVFENDWAYLESNFTKTTGDQIINRTLNWKPIADGNDHSYTGEWSEAPELIFDGGVN